MKSNCYDSNRQLNHNSWTNGGTFITNFNVDDIQNYVKAIEVYERKEDPYHKLVISGFAYENSGFPVFSYSLHQLEHKGDLSAFWIIFDNIKYENK